MDHYLRTSSNVPYSQRGPATQRTDATELDDLTASGHGRDSAGAKIVYEEKKVQYMMKKLQDEVIDAYEPLILSLVHTMFDELNGLHRMLRNLTDVLEEPMGSSSGK